MGGLVLVDMATGTQSPYRLRLTRSIAEWIFRRKSGLLISGFRNFVSLSVRSRAIGDGVVERFKGH